MSNPVDLAARMLSHVTMIPFGDLPKDVQSRAVTLIEDLLTENSLRATRLGVPVGRPIVDELLHTTDRALTSLVDIEAAKGHLAAVGVTSPDLVVSIARQLAVTSTASLADILLHITKVYAQGSVTSDLMQWLAATNTTTPGEWSKVLGVPNRLIIGEVQAGRVKPTELLRVLGLIAHTRSDVNSAEQALARQDANYDGPRPIRPDEKRRPGENRADRRRNKRKRG